MKEILIIVPTRGRNQNHLDLIESWRFTTSGHSDLVFGLDDDDEMNYSRISDVKYEVGERIRLAPTLNKIAKKYHMQYKYIGFLGDDHRFRTKGWEDMFLSYLQKTPLGIVYGNDLLQKEAMATAGIVDSKIIALLDYMVPTNLIHFRFDIFWCDLGKALQTLKYFPNVIIEHMHPAVGKSKMDKGYTEVNNQELYTKDQASYELYLRDQFALDVNTLKTWITKTIS